MLKPSKSNNLGTNNVGRREFIRDSAVVCCMASLPFSLEGSSTAIAQDQEGTAMKPTELGTYCGLYCGACDIYQKRIGKSGNELKKVLDSYNFGEMTAQIPGFEDYETFYKILNNLISFFGDCPSCRKGGGDPACKVRICAKEKGYQTCAECPSMPCDKIKDMGLLPYVEGNLKEINKIGYEAWCQKQQERVNQGFRYSNIG